MNKENLKKLRDICIRALDQAKDVDIVDRNEALLNLYHFLDPENYEDNIRTLQRRKIENEQESIFTRNNRNKRGSS